MTKLNDTNKPTNCLNCEHLLNDKDYFCPNCGQKALPERLTLKYFFLEFLSNYFSFDSKFFNTVKQLVLKPAFLSREFITGRRIRYINPIQLFIFSSFLYFLVNSFMILKEDADEGYVTITDKSNNKIRVDSVNVEQVDSLFIARDGQETDTFENSNIGKFVKRGQDFNSMDKASRNEKISKSFSYAVFLLTPLFALYLGLLFKKRKKHYLENIIFSLHFHAFYFIVGVIVLLFDRLLTGDIDNIILIVLVMTYLFIAVKRFYNFSWLSTGFRFLGLVLLYGLTVAVVLLSSLILTILL
jgi:hypothetical protein